VIDGAPGWGKSTIVARAVARDLLENGRRAVIHDPTGSIVRYCIERFGVPREWCVRVATAKAAREHYRWGWFKRLWTGLSGARLISMGRVNGKGNVRCLAHQFIEVAHDAKEGWVYGTDEAEMAFSPRELPEKCKHCNLEMLEDKRTEVIKYARNNRVRLYAAGQRPQHTMTLLRSNAAMACVFHADSRAFVEQGCSEFGDPSLFEEAYSLECFEYLFRAKERPDELAPFPLYHALEDPIPWT
jgi:hypothetical protein